MLIAGRFILNINFWHLFSPRNIICSGLVFAEIKNIFPAWYTHTTITVQRVDFEVQIPTVPSPENIHKTSFNSVLTAWCRLVQSAKRLLPPLPSLP